MKPEVLLVEDTLDFQDLVSFILKDQCNLTIAPSIKATLELVKRKKFDLVLMDVMLEDGSGFELMQQLNALPSWEETPVIFMTSKSDIEDKTTGFTLGAEDYIVKPFEPNEFRLRVKSRLRKVKNKNLPSEMIRGNLRLEVAVQKAYLVKENENLHLTPLEFKILFTLAKNEPEVLSRDQITKLIWGDGVVVGRSLDTHVTSLRKKLGPSGLCISSIYGQGYRFFSKD